MESTETPSMTLEAHNFEQLHELVCPNQANTLVVLDIDNVLLIPSEAAFQAPNLKLHKKIFRDFLSALTPQEVETWLNLMVLRYPSLLMESTSAKIIKEWQRQNTKVIALTAVWNGVGPEGQNLAERRRQILKNFDIDFSSAFKASPFTINEEEDTSFLDGIIFASHIYADKGAILLEALDQLEYKPERVIFVDDYKPNVEKMQKALRGTGIHFIGVHYLAAYGYPSREVSAEEFTERCQLLIDEAKSL